MSQVNLFPFQRRIGALLMVVGAIALLGWLTGLRILASVHPAYLPMPQGTALSCLILGALLLVDLSSVSGRKRLALSAAAGLVAVYGLLKFVEYLVHADLTFADVLLPVSERLGPYPLTRMSPITGAFLFLSGTALELKLWFSTRTETDTAVAVVGLGTLSVGLIAMLGYLYGSPLLYGGGIIPLSLPTSLGFVLLGSGLIILAQPGTMFLRWLMGETPRARVVRWLVLTMMSLLLLDGFLDARVFDWLNLSRPFSTAIETLVFMAVMFFVGVRMTHVIFRDAEEADRLRRQDEAALRESEQRNQLISRATNDALWDLDLTLDRIRWNEGITKLFGYVPPESHTSLAWWSDRLHPDDRAPIERSFTAAVRGSANEWTAEYRFRCADDTYRDVFDRGTFVRDGNGRAVRALGAMTDITALKQAEHRLRLALQHLRSHEDNSPLAVMEFSSTLELIKWSRNAERLFGWRADEVLGKHIGDLRWVHEDDAQRVADISADMLAGRKTSNTHKNRNYRKDGSVVVCEWYNSALTDVNGHLISVQSLVLDVTERTQAEEALRKSESRFKRLVHDLAAGVLLHGPDGEFVLGNPKASELLGLTDTQLAGTEPYPAGWSVVGENGYPMADPLAPVRQVITTRRPVRDVIMGVCRRTGDERVWLLANSEPELGPEGAVLQVICTFIDITERRKFERTLQNQRDEFETMFNLVPAQIWYKDTRNRIMRVNGQVCRDLGMTHDQLEGHTADEVFPQFARQYYEDDLEVIETRKPKRGIEEQITAASGELRWVHTDKVPVFGPDGEVISLVAFTQDITERKRAEQTRKELERQLAQSQRMEAIGILSSGVAHDFNNILNIILGNLNLLEQAPEDREKFHRRTEAIGKATERGAHLVRQLLTFARQTSSNRRLVSANELIREIWNLFDETFPKNIAVSLQLDAGPARIDVDQNQIHQVLLNLSVNARDAMPSGGKLSIATSVVPATELRGRYADVGAPDYVRIAIADTGIGIEEQDLKKIFDPFFSTKEIGKGTGLGLAVVYGIVQNHGGFIDVASQVGHGTEFRIYLPVAQEGEPPEEESPAPVPDAQEGTETILFVDDEHLAREIAMEHLSEKGYRVLVAADGEEAVDVFRRHSADIALVLSDYGLPRCDGEEVYRRIRQINPRVPFMLMTGFIEPEKEKEFEQLGVRLVIRKPYRFTDVMARMRTILDEAQR